MKRFGIYILSIVAFTSCKKDETTLGYPEDFKASLIIETSNATDTIIQGDENYFGFISNSGETINAPDSLELMMSVGLYLRSGVRFNVQDALYVTYYSKFHKSVLDNDRLSEDQFHEIYKVGSRQYSLNGKSYEGVGITWYDSQGTQWSSAKYLKDNQFPTIPIHHTNAKFEIVKSFKYRDSNTFFKWAQKVRIKANCTLYNYRNDSLILKNLDYSHIVRFKNY